MFEFSLEMNLNNLKGKWKMSLFTWPETGQAQSGSRGAPAPRSRLRCPNNSSDHQRQGGTGRGARATRRGGEPVGGVSERRAHRSGLSVRGVGWNQWWGKDISKPEWGSPASRMSRWAAHDRGGAYGWMSLVGERAGDADISGVLGGGLSGQQEAHGCAKWVASPPERGTSSTTRRKCSRAGLWWRVRWSASAWHEE
jgi:hypothetical protein